MNHADHVDLLRQGVPGLGGIWADLGSGTGAFTLALAELIGPEGTIYSIDRDAAALREQQKALKERFPEVRVEIRQADFTRPLDLPPLDGIVMANSLHFHRRKEAILMQVREYLKQGGRFLLVEYNADRGNPWVPFPLSYASWEALAQRCGFGDTRLMVTHPSWFLGEIYSAVSINPGSSGSES